MTHTLKRIGFRSAVKISAIIAAVAAVLPILAFVLLNDLLKFWDIVIPPNVLFPVLVSAALWAAVAGAVSTALVVALYNLVAACCGGITLELQPQRPPRKSKESVDID